ncbi:hypothetical protein C8R46DRAFT_1043783 [Mycena filopes]|nr:hypothetical protein C8R46DRAFT_1043783 [Mycena filopes]
MASKAKKDDELRIESLSSISMSLQNAQQLADAARRWIETKPAAHFAPPGVALHIPTQNEPEFLQKQARGRKSLQSHLAPLLLNALLSEGLATPIVIQALLETISGDIEAIVSVPPSSFYALVFAVLSNPLQDEKQFADWLDAMFTELFDVITAEAKKIPSPVVMAPSESAAGLRCTKKWLDTDGGGEYQILDTTGSNVMIRLRVLKRS